MEEIKCDNCEKTFKIYRCYLKRKRKNRFCSKKCESEYKKYNNTCENWKGGHISKSTGYKYVVVNGRQIEEHRLIMMKELKRPLEVYEHVHHINGNKLDNRIENLMLLTNKEHLKLHGSEKNNKRKCLLCKQYKEHHGRGLCHTCYHKVLIRGKLYEYELVGKK